MNTIKTEIKVYNDSTLNVSECQLSGKPGTDIIDLTIRTKDGDLTIELSGAELAMNITRIIAPPFSMQLSPSAMDWMVKNLYSRTET